MVEADKVLDPQELQYMNKYLHFYYPTSTAEEYFKIFEKKVNDLFAGADPEGKKLQEILKEIANAYDYADKFFLLLTLFKIASVDGIAETEEKFLRNVAERLSVKQDDLNYLFNMFTGSTFETATRFLKFSGTPEKTDIFYPGIDVEFIVFEVAKAYLIFNRTGKDSVKLNQQHLKPGFALRFFRDQILEVGAYAIPIQLLQKFFVAKYNEVGDIHCFLENKKGEQGLSVAFHKSNASIAELEIKNNINKLTPLKQGGGCKVNDAALMEASYINLGDRISVDGILVDFTGLLSDFIYNRQYVSYAGKKDLLIDFPGTIHDLNFKIEGEKVYVVPTGRLNQIYVNDELVSSQREVGANDLIYCNKTITRVDPTKNLISTGPFKFKKIRSAEVKFVFKTKQVGLDNVTFEIAQNELVCVMGPSGCGKSTLLNIMNGYMLPTTGNVMIDGYDFFKQHDAYKDHVGYVPQDDLLFETLTVFENLYYNCSLRFPSKSEEEKKRLIIDVLTKVGLASKRDTKVGNPLEKTLSGGERKRVNIALELLSGVSILFLDEPTSGLSSKDSEKIVSLLRQIADEGKMVFVVIHQPSSKLYRTFDKLILLDKGGKLAFFGPVQDALVYFKKHRDSTIEDDAKLDPNHIEPEILLEALEEPLLDLDGSPLDERKYSPDYWKDRFKDYSKTLPRYEAPAVEEKAPLPPIRWSGMVERFTQLKMLLARSFKTLFRNRSNLLISFIEAPLLGFLISLILRYDSKYDHYSLYNNELLTSWMFLTVVVVLFLGMTNSVETIIQDRLILLRERMLNISNLSYYISKLVPLFFFSVVQNFLYLGVSFLILELRELFFEYMIITIVLSVCGISIGLFLSSLPKISSKAAFNIVPIILIPQIIFGGALIAYEDMNKSIRFYKNDPIPEISQIMPSRWAYEALMDLQGRHNNYDKESERLVQDRTTFVQTRDGFKEQFGEAMYQQKKYELETRINEHETNFRDKYGNEKVSLALKDGRQKYRAMIARDSTHSFVYPLFVPEKKLPFVGVISTVYYDTIIMIVMFALFSIGTILSLAYGAIAFDKLSALLRRA
jgi:ABC-type multidrug transport system ATPase subunit/uncharacterized tellurite resistance protein B-like protein